MTPISRVNSPWATTSNGDAPVTSPMELSALGEHLDICRGSGGRLFTLQCMAESANGFVSARLVSTVVVVALLVGISSLIL